jgi:predicted transposase/invertase (TIGR01784 family)
MRFADIKNDVAFRKIFGNRKKTHILISFLNAVLQLEGKQRLVSVKLEDPYQFPRVAGEKSSILDVRATDGENRQFVIEMQVTEPKSFDKRVQYYASRDYSMQIDKGENYTKLRPTIFIGILDFNYFKGKDYLSYHSLLDEKTYEHKLKDLRFAFLELRKFKKTANALESLVDKWAFFIKNSEKLAFIPDNVDDPGLKEAYLDADRHTWSKEDLKAYDNESIAEQDARGVLELAEERAEARGKAEGKAELVLAAHERGNTAEQISEFLGLPMARVKEILAGHRGK